MTMTTLTRMNWTDEAKLVLSQLVEITRIRLLTTHGAAKISGCLPQESYMSRGTRI